MYFTRVLVCVAKRALCTNRMKISLVQMEMWEEKWNCKFDMIMGNNPMWLLDQYFASGGGD